MDKITKITNQNHIIHSLDDVERVARAMAGSGFFQDVKQANQATVKILAGRELGFGPFASMIGVSINKGKPVIAAVLYAAAIKRTKKYNYRIAELTEEACEIEFIENGAPVGRSRFCMKDAIAAGLAGEDNWKKFPRNMLFARAISNGARWYTPDIFNGAVVYTPDELGADDGDIIVKPDRETDYERAAARLTPGGKRYDELSIEQLNMVISGKNINEASKDAARIVLDHDFGSEMPADAAMESSTGDESVGLDPAPVSGGDEYPFQEAEENE